MENIISRLNIQRTNIRRTVHTDAFSPKAKAILEALQNYMYDCWDTTQMKRNAVLAEVAVNPNGEIVWNVYDNASYRHDWRYYSSYYSNSTYACRANDQKVREWLAVTMKHAIFTELNKIGGAESLWKRNCTKKLDCLSANGNETTVAEAYCLYDRLLNRKSFSKRWSKPMLKAVIGEERDPVATELEIARREELKKLDEKFEIDKKALRMQRSDELDKVNAEISKKYEQLNSDLLAAYMKSKKELNDSLSYIQEQPSSLV